MRLISKLLAASVCMATMTSGHAQTAATAVTDLNIRTGPGPQYPVIGLIAQNGIASVNGCLDGSKWCLVDHHGVQGWSYSDYLTAPYSGSAVVMTDNFAQVGVPVATYESSEGAEAGGTAGVATGAVGGAIAGALVAGPVGAIGGAVIGGAAGGITGSAAGAAIDPPKQAISYVKTNPAEPIYLEGEVVIGAGLPKTVQLRPIPDYGYDYIYVNGQPALVDPATRQIVYVIR